MVITPLVRADDNSIPKQQAGPSLGVSPKITLLATVALIIAMIIGSIESPENADKIFDRCTPILAILVLALRQDYLAYQLAKQTIFEAQQAKETVHQESEKLQQAVSHTIEKVDTVARQTNGDLHQKLEDIATDVKTTIKQNEEIIKTAMKPPQ